MDVIKIPYKFPSLNEYINECRKNRYAGANMKKRVQEDIGYFINRLPEYDKPITIHFVWTEGNKRRDLDNVSSMGRKFILDTLVSHGKIKDDNRNFVVGFRDDFRHGDDFEVMLIITEVEDGRQEISS